MSSYNRMIDELTDMVQHEHCEGCCDETCDLNASYDSGYSLWAITLFAGSGAASDEFEATYARLVSQYGKRFARAAERERADFCATVGSIECMSCGSYTWLTDYVDAEYYKDPGACCANCGGPIHGKVVENENG